MQGVAFHLHSYSISQRKRVDEVRSEFAWIRGTVATGLSRVLLAQCPASAARCPTSGTNGPVLAWPGAGNHRTQCGPALLCNATAGFPLAEPNSLRKKSLSALVLPRGAWSSENGPRNGFWGHSPFKERGRPFGSVRTQCQAQTGLCNTVLTPFCGCVLLGTHLHDPKSWATQQNWTSCVTQDPQQPRPRAKSYVQSGTKKTLRKPSSVDHCLLDPPQHKNPLRKPTAASATLQNFHQKTHANLVSLRHQKELACVTC